MNLYTLLIQFYFFNYKIKLIINVSLQFNKYFKYFKSINLINYIFLYIYL